MSTNDSAELTFDEIDDVLYFVRTNDTTELETLLTELSKKFQISTGEILIRCVDPENENNVLHYCAANGFDNLFPILLKSIQEVSTAPQANGLNTATSFINKGNKLGNTPLHWAALNGHLAVVKQLIEAGADMWIKNAAGHLAMFEAERAEKNDVVQYLLEAGGREVEHTGNEQTEDVDLADEAESSSAAEAAG